MPQVLTELDIDRWAEIFRANHLSARSAGLTLEQFLQRPEGLLQALIYDQAVPLEEDQDFYGLLPKQRLVQARIVAADSLRVVAENLEAQLVERAGARMHGDRYLQPLKHHSYSLSRDRTKQKTAP